MKTPIAEFAGRSVLVVEDNYLVALTLQEGLTDAGLSVLGPFASEALAAAAWQEVPPHFAILDVNIRGGTSIPLASALVARDTCCVFLTGYATIADLPDTLAHIPKLLKPVEVGQLLRVFLAHQLGQAGICACFPLD